MAMEKYRTVRDVHTKCVTALGYNPAWRDIVFGCQDGTVRCWSEDTDKLSQAYREHNGWVTHFVYWSETKLFLSSSNDGSLILWSSGCVVTDRIFLGKPIYCMALNHRRQQLLCASRNIIRIYRLDESKECGHVINPAVLHIAKHHTDIICAVVCHESRIFSGGFDQRLIIYDLSYANEQKICPLVVKNKAHEAGLTCVVHARDCDNNVWIVTGSFDKTVKIWSIDGQPVHKIDNFLAPISSICYCPRDRTIWVTAGLSSATLFEPKSGDNVTECVATFQQEADDKYHLQLLKFLPELNQVVGSTSRKHLIVWKYNSSGCLTALKARNCLESLCYTSQEPVLYFSADSKGIFTRWERTQSNFFMYSKQEYNLNDVEHKNTLFGDNSGFVYDNKHADNDDNNNDDDEDEDEDDNDGDEDVGNEGNEDDDDNDQQNVRGAHKKQEFSQSSEEQVTPSMVDWTHHYNETQTPPSARRSRRKDRKGIIKVIFVESLDFLVVGCEDGKIYVWGFDVATAERLHKIIPKEKNIADTKYSVLLDRHSELLNTRNTEESTSNKRVADFICIFILEKHGASVTSFIAIDRTEGFGGTFLVSSGWDSQLCVWNLESGQLHDIYQGCPKRRKSRDNFLPACDGAILDMDYSPSLQEFIYASCDTMAYIRKFSSRTDQMLLQNTLQGHGGDVVACKWNGFISKWITATEHGFIRIWSSIGLNNCEQVLSAHGSIYCLIIDHLNGNIIAGVQNTIKVFDVESYCVVQMNVGHTDVIRDIVHVPARNQYVSCSWDQTVRVWKACIKKSPRNVS